MRKEIEERRHRKQRTDNNNNNNNKKRDRENGKRSMQRYSEEMKVKGLQKSNGLHMRERAVVAMAIDQS